jgi:hypothetical protein
MSGARLQVEPARPRRPAEDEARAKVLRSGARSRERKAKESLVLEAALHWFDEDYVAEEEHSTIAVELAEACADLRKLRRREK